MDPFTAVGLLFSVVDLIDRTSKCVRKVKEAYDSKTGLPREQDSLLGYSEEMINLLDKIQEDSQKLEQLRDSSKNDDNSIQVVITRCHDISSNIMSLLNRDRPERPHSIKSAIKATVRSIFNKKSFRDLQADLERGQKTLHLALVSSMKTQIDHILDILKNTTVKNDEVEQQLERVQSKLDSTNNSLYDRFQEILSLCYRAQDIQKLDVILSKIRKCQNGTQPNPRYDEVHDNFANTFEWIFREPQKLFEAEPDLKMSFTDWLRDGEGIFHILGKPGAGKSTLMKFIWKHELTKDMLIKWAGTSQLLCLKYFFWSTSHQDGLLGLKCSLLRSSLEQAPELMEQLFPDSNGLDKKATTSINHEEISRAVNLLISNPFILERYRIFILMDGLDEFDEKKHAEDYHDLVRLIQNWTFLSGMRVKVCISSREYEAFVAISRHQRIRLHNLTRQDIQAYVTERLETHSRFSELQKSCARRRGNLCGDSSHRRCSTQSLVNHIVDIAEGIFLWVRLAMLEVRKFLNSDYDIDRVWKYIDTRPKPLLDYLKHMLDSISDVHQKEAYIILAINNTYASMTHPTQVSILGASYVSEKLSRDAKEPHSEQLNSIDSELQRNDWHIFKREQIHARFNGLLELSKDHSLGWGFELRHPLVLTFTHRSIIEILQNDIDTKLLKHRITKPELVNWACQLFLGEVILSRNKLVDLKYPYYCICRARFLAAFFENLNFTGEPSIERRLDQIEDTCLKLQFGTPYPPPTVFWSFDIRTRSFPECPYYCSFLLTASSFGLTAILPWILRRMNNVPKRSHLETDLVWYCMAGHYKYRSGSGNITLMAEFLRNGFVGSDLRDTEARVQVSKHGCHTTMPWIYWVAHVIHREVRRKDTWTMMELWLENGANPRIQLHCVIERSYGIKLVEVHTHCGVVVKINGRHISHYTGERLLPESDNRFAPLYLSQKPLTLRDFVISSDAYNKQRLLELIDHNTALLEADEAAEETYATTILKRIPWLGRPDVFGNAYLPSVVVTTWNTYFPKLRNILSWISDYFIKALMFVAILLLMFYLVTVWSASRHSSHPEVGMIDRGIVHDML
ncbi:uncharacterized protein F4817DRAFT_363355 [Daldinia loculata]|uniref:uncharacterized protein n=1 Tax=Daldinia loculata TaxID=103429 RepID=UPI0020C4CD49|nr:uncharacterized protein F4817DRAFT_363355 [Daldinia loculata]KAI1642011.1 hypothetical protein F4817DRAFT_363355 [Daldinia loculata]